MKKSHIFKKGGSEMSKGAVCLLLSYLVLCIHCAANLNLLSTGMCNKMSRCVMFVQLRDSFPC